MKTRRRNHLCFKSQHARGWSPFCCIRRVRGPQNPSRSLEKYLGVKTRSLSMSAFTSTIKQMVYDERNRQTMNGCVGKSQQKPDIQDCLNNLKTLFKNCGVIPPFPGDDFAYSHHKWRSRLPHYLLFNLLDKNGVQSLFSTLRKNPFPPTPPVLPV